MKKKSKRLWWGLFVAIMCGASAVYLLYEAWQLVSLNYSHELVEGSIEKVELYTTKKSFGYQLVCSYRYDGKEYKEKIRVSMGIPFVTSLSEDYPTGKTLFMINKKNDVIFPQGKIGLELRRRVPPFLLVSWGLIFSLKSFFNKTQKPTREFTIFTTTNSQKTTFITTESKKTTWFKKD
ncbi:MAG: hypothetical protein LBP24_02530 [Coriobacteriales bacterium]|jgi:hypothetical protein|nr:hypothetical protein [Coriobacteriales bacterium]